MDKAAPIELPVPRVGPLFSDTVVKLQGDSRDLLVMLHGAWAGPTALASVQQACFDLLPHTDILAPDYPAGVFSEASPEAIAVEFRDLVRKALAIRPLRPDGRQYAGIQLLGWSIGTPIVLRAYIDERLNGWAPLVSRIILFAAHTWGWSLEEPLPGMPKARYVAYRAIMQTFEWVHEAQTVRGVRRGEPFVERLKADWADLLNAGVKDLPEIVAFDGAEDEWLTKEDKTVISDFPTFRQVTCPCSGHISLSIMDDSPLGRARKAKLAEVFGVPISAEEQVNLEQVIANEEALQPGTFAI